MDKVQHIVEVRTLIEKESKAWCVEVKCKRRRRILAKLRSGTARLEVKMGRWLHVSDKLCRSGIVVKWRMWSTW